MAGSYRKWLVIAASAGLLFCATGEKNADASDITYDELNIDITAAVDRYIVAGGENLTQQPYEIRIGDASGAVAVFTVGQEIKNASQTDAQMLTKADEKLQSEGDTGAGTPQSAEFQNKALVVSSGYVNIRAAGSIDAERVGSIGPNGIMTVEQKGADWSLISSGDCRGYIKNEFLVFGAEAFAYAEANLTKVAVVNADALKVRAGESDKSECLAFISGGERYGIVSQGEEWTCIEIDNSLSGYVKNDYIDITYNTVYAITVEQEAATAQNSGGSTLNESSENTSNDAAATASNVGDTQNASEVSNSGTGADVANYALQFVGNPYVYGGTSLTNGADCSGFVMSVYAAFGVSLPRTADVQATVGTEVSLSELQPGDLVFYDHGTGSVQHVALYIGNGQIVHASTSRTGIIVADMNYSTACKAVRILY